MKRLVATHSQHFLRSPALIAELVGHSKLKKRDTVLDIGAGSGAVSAVLARRVARVIAYEIEPHTRALLEKNMRQYANVTVTGEDFLCAELPQEPYKVFANIPFSLSSQIVRKLVAASTPPEAIYLIVQKQFAQKLLTTGTRFHGALGMMIAPWWLAKIRRPLRRTDFTPPPAVDTVLLELLPRPEPLVALTQREVYEQFVTHCYAEPKFYHAQTATPDKKPSELTLTQWQEFFAANH